MAGLRIGSTVCSTDHEQLRGHSVSVWALFATQVLEAAKELEMVAGPEEDETLAFAYLWQTQACLSLGRLLAAETAAKKSYHHCLKPNDIEVRF